MPRTRKPRAGSLQFWPRKRSKRPYPRVRRWNGNQPQLLGFAGYKVGMSHVVLKDNRVNSLTKGGNIVWPITILECPGLKIFSVRGYIKDEYGSKILAEVLNKKLDKQMGKKVKLAKKSDFEAKLKEFESKIDGFDDIRVLVYTQPSKIGFGKKKPDVFEMAIGGTDVKVKYEYVKGLLDKEVKVADLYKSNTIVDVHSVSKGKGFQGALKRLGLTLRSHKSEKSRRTGNPAAEGYAKVSYTAPMPGRMGYNVRTEYNKEILFVGDKPETLNIKSGFRHYGNVKNDYVLIKGSVPGAIKRLMRFNESLRKARSSAVEVVQVRKAQ